MRDLVLRAAKLPCPLLSFHLKCACAYGTVALVIAFTSSFVWKGKIFKIHRTSWFYSMVYYVFVDNISINTLLGLHYLYLHIQQVLFCETGVKMACMFLHNVCTCMHAYTYPPSSVRITVSCYGHISVFQAAVSFSVWIRVLACCLFHWSPTCMHIAWISKSCISFQMQADWVLGLNDEREKKVFIIAGTERKKKLCSLNSAQHEGIRVIDLLTNFMHTILTNIAPDNLKACLRFVRLSNN